MHQDLIPVEDLFIHLITFLIIYFLGFFNAAYKMLHEGLNASINSNASIDARKIKHHILIFAIFQILNILNFKF